MSDTLERAEQVEEAQVYEVASLLMVGDVHVSDRPPSTRTESYRDDILRKLIEIGSLSKSVDAVVFVGDIFHSKKPTNTSHQTVQAVARILQSYHAPVFILPGNHDYAGQHHESLTKHPLGTVGLMPNVTLFGTEQIRQVVISKGGMPGNYDQGWPVARLWGVREEEPIESFCFPPVSGIPAMPTVVVAHSAIFPPGETPGVWEAFDADDVAQTIIDHEWTLPADILSRVKKLPVHVWYGHIHEPHGTYEVRGIPFTNLGAISRGSLHEDGAMERTPQVGLLTIWDDQTTTVNPIDLESARPAAEVFRVQEVLSERAREAERNAFAEALSVAEVEVFSVETAVQAITAHPDAPEPVKARAVELIREVTG